jgi:hypothetical protein
MAVGHGPTLAGPRVGSVLLWVPIEKAMLANLLTTTSSLSVCCQQRSAVQVWAGQEGVVNATLKCAAACDTRRREFS